jgi:hypothetical protein
MFGPLALNNGSWYVPSVHPFYGKASAIMRIVAGGPVFSRSGAVCITVHMDQEFSRDRFVVLQALLRKIGLSVVPWTVLEGKSD